MDIFKKCSSMMEMLREVREKEIYPYFHALETGQDTVVRMNNRETIMIGSNNYLGLTSHPEVIEAGVAAIKKYGSGCSGSRFLNGTLDIHLALESELAEFLGKEDVMTFSTGFQTNLGILSAMQEGMTSSSATGKTTRASMTLPAFLCEIPALQPQRHGDLENTLKSIPEDKGVLIVTDGAFSMTGDIANLPEIVRLAKKYGARVMVDDAHASAFWANMAGARRTFRP